MPITVTTVATLAEAARAVEANRGARILGGGTVLMRALNEADPDVTALVRVTDPALTTIRVEGNALRLGAGVTMAALARDRDAAFLAPVARLIGGPQVRAAATVAGNLFAGAPYGDFAGALLALSATVETADGRRIPVDEVLRPGTRPPVVAAIHIPRQPLHFKKVTRVKPKGISLLSLAAVLPGAPNRIASARIVWNGMADHPVRAQGAERALEGQRLDPATIARAASAAAEGLTPRDDALATGWYRREVAGVHLTRLLESVR